MPFKGGGGTWTFQVFEIIELNVHQAASFFFKLPIYGLNMFIQAFSTNFDKKNFHPFPFSGNPQTQKSLFGRKSFTPNHL